MTIMIAMMMIEMMRIEKSWKNLRLNAETGTDRSLYDAAAAEGNSHFGLSQPKLLSP